MVGELIMRCLHGRTNAHVPHLNTPSYAKRDKSFETDEERVQNTIILPGLSVTGAQ